MKLTKREICTLFAVLLYASILLGGYYIIQERTTEAAMWERKYNTAKETEARAVELLGATIKEFDAYKAQVELDKRIEEAVLAQAMANYEALGKYQYLGEFMITHYCCEPYNHICGTGDGITASGIPVSPGIIAVDPDVIPLGSTVIINGIPYLAADTGVLVKDNHIDIAVETHEEAVELGISSAEVWLVVDVE